LLKKIWGEDGSIATPPGPRADGMARRNRPPLGSNGEERKSISKGVQSATPVVGDPPKRPNEGRKRSWLLGSRGRDLGDQGGRFGLDQDPRRSQKEGVRGGGEGRHRGCQLGLGGAVQCRGGGGEEGGWAHGRRNSLNRKTHLVNSLGPPWQVCAEAVWTIMEKKGGNEKKTV